MIQKPFFALAPFLISDLAMFLYQHIRIGLFTALVIPLCGCLTVMHWRKQDAFVVNF